MRNQHSDTLDQFNNVGLFDPAIDALIERSEAAIDREENIRLVKQIQMEALKRYSTSINLFTQQIQRFYNAKLQNFEIDPLAGQNFQYNAWFA
jgi:ABC-type transport system substrate-binding protein